MGHIQLERHHATAKLFSSLNMNANQELKISKYNFNLVEYLNTVSGLDSVIII